MLTFKFTYGKIELPKERTEKTIVSRYFIGQGTSITADFDTEIELNQFFDSMPDIDRHFCRIYDTQKHINVLGWKYQYGHKWEDGTNV